MILITHIVIALSSIGLATWALVWPSQAKMRANYAFIAATLGSGTWLVVSTHSPLLSSCMSGLMYLAVVSALLAVSRYRLSQLER